MHLTSAFQRCFAKVAFVSVFLILISFSSVAQDIAPPIPERLVLHSTILDEDRLVFVRLPHNYAGGNARYPVLYLTDGDIHTNEIGSVIDFLATNNLLPELIVIGIVNTDRDRDFTPTHADVKKADGTIVFRVPTSGGADKFLKFMGTELIPEIQRRYRTEPFRILAGHSLGGLFALHVLITRPTLFQSSIAVSPSLEWDNEIILHRLAQFLASTKQLQATLFFSLSDEGVNIKRFGDDFEKLRQILTEDAPVGLAWDSIIMKDEDHSSGVLRAHYSGLKKIFSGWRVERDPKTQLPVGGLTGIEQHYRELSHRFGYQVSAEQAIDEYGYQLMQQGPNEALAAFRRNAELYPDSANVYNSLGDCYEALGEPELAKQSVSKSIELATKANSPQVSDFKEHLQRLTSAKRPD